MSGSTNYGPGDECTWGPYLGHPNDPRAPDVEYEDEDEDEDEEDGNEAALP
jgi:hypothetical protein